MLRRSVLVVAGTLLATSGVPAHAVAAVDHRATPAVRAASTPLYPLPGQTARLTIRVGGTHGPATGWVRVRFEGVVIPRCAHLTLRRGTATCLAPVTWRATRTFLVGYQGSATYRPRTITRLVRS